MFKVIHNKNFIKSITIGFLILIIAYGAFLRIYKLDAQSYWIDEGYTLNAVLSTLEKGYPILDSGGNYGRSLLNTYLIAGAVKIGGFNPIATRSVAVAFGLGSIFLVYLLGKRFFNQLVGLGAATLTSLSYWEISWSRQARMYMQLQFFFLLSLYLFQSLLEKFSYRKLGFVILATLAAILSHFFGFFLLGIYLIMFIIEFKRKGKTIIKKSIKNAQTKSIVGLLILVVSPLLGWLGYRIYSTLDSHTFLGQKYVGFLLDSYPLILLLALAGVIFGIFTKNKLFSTILLALGYLVPYTLIVFSVDTQHYRYLFFIFPILLIFATQALFALSAKTKQTTIVFLILIVVLLTTSIMFNKRAFVFMPQENYYLATFTPQPDFKKAYEAIKRHGWDQDKIIISPFTQMDKVYLGRSDYWLAIDLAGRPLNYDSLPEREGYNNAITITSAEQLKNIIDEHSGYLVVDDMASIRLSEDINKLIETKTPIFYELSKQKSRIWVFEF